MIDEFEEFPGCSLHCLFASPASHGHLQKETMLGLQQDVGTPPSTALQPPSSPSSVSCKAQTSANPGGPVKVPQACRMPSPAPKSQIPHPKSSSALAHQLGALKRAPGQDPPQSQEGSSSPGDTVFPFDSHSTSPHLPTRSKRLLGSGSRIRAGWPAGTYQHVSTLPACVCSSSQATPPRLTTPSSWSHAPCPEAPEAPPLSGRSTPSD